MTAKVWLGVHLGRDWGEVWRFQWRIFVAIWGPQEAPIEHFGRYFIVSDAMFSQLLKASSFFHMCPLILHDFGVVLVMDISLSFIEEAFPIPSMIFIHFCSCCGSPFGSENLRRSAFYTGFDNLDHFHFISKMYHRLCNCVMISINRLWCWMSKFR